MKLFTTAAVAMLALSGAAFAQSSSTEGMNGLTLGKSMPGVNNGVPYPNTNATDGTATVGRSGATPRRHHHRKHHRH